MNQIKVGVFVSNADQGILAGMRSLVTNYSASLIRNDVMEGKPFIVVPMVMAIADTVMNSLLYPADELSKTPTSWNYKPVVVYHPTMNGQGISACTPEIITQQKIGVIMNAKFEPAAAGKSGRLVAEAWLEEDRVKTVDIRVWNSIQKKKVMELSTGLFIDVEVANGESGGKPYVGIARNYRPDHLAVLPDQTGAISVADGAGFIRNSLEATLGTKSEHLERLTLRVLNELQLNAEMSNETKRGLISTALRDRFPSKSESSLPSYSPYVEAVFSDFVVYDHQGKFWKISYSIDDKSMKAKLIGVPTEVIRVSEFRTVDGAIVGNSTTQPTQPKTTMDKKVVINGLIANAASGWSETHRQFLESCDDTQLGVIAANAEKATKPAAPAGAPAPQVPALNAEEQEALNYGKQQLALHKNKCIETIVANTANKFTREQLAVKSISELEAIAAIASNQAPAQAPTPHYGGQAPVIQPAANTAKVEPLDTPAWDSKE